MNKRFLSIPEVADLLIVSVSTVRRMIKSQAFRTHRFGRQIRVDRHDLERFVDQSRD